MYGASAALELEDQLALSAGSLLQAMVTYMAKLSRPLHQVVCSQSTAAWRDNRKSMGGM